jgi:MoxR-like ATPase
MFKVTVDPPTADVLEEILRRTTTGSVPEVPLAADIDTITSMISMTPLLPVATHLLQYVARIIEATHPDGDTASPPVKRYVRWGASPRGAQSMILAAKANALLEARPHVTAEDIRWAAPAALRHRLVLGYEATAEGVRADAIIDELLHEISEPKSDIRGAP